MKLTIQTKAQRAKQLVKNGAKVADACKRL